MSIKNLATYEDCTINFTEFNYPMFITGKTGSGKTTLFVDAITAALYSKAYDEKIRGIYKELIMKGKQVGEVQLEFEVEDIIYKVQRRFYANGVSEASLWKWDNKNNYWSPITFSVRDVDKEIIKIVGLNFDSLLNSAIIRQGNVYTFLRKKPSERRELLLNILNIRFDELRNKARDKVNEIKVNIAKLETSISEKEEKIKEEPKLLEEKNSIKEKMPKMEEELKKSKREKEALQKKLKELNTNMGKLQKELSDMEEAEKTLREKIKKRDIILENITQIENMLKRFTKEKVVKADEYEGKINDLEKLMLKKQSEELKLSNLRQKLQKSKELKQVEKELEKLKSIEEELRSKQQELDNLNEQIGGIKNKKSEVEEILSTLSTLKETATIECPVCGTPLSEEKIKTREQHLAHELENIKRKLAKLNEERRRLKDIIKELKKKKSYKDKLEEALRRLTKELKGKIVTGEEVKKQEETLRSLEQTIITLLDDIKSFTSAKSIEEAKKTINTLKNVKNQMPRLEELKKRLNELNEEIAKLEKKVSKKNILKQELSKTQNIIKALEKQVKELSERIEKVTKKISALEQRVKDIDREMNLIAEYKTIIEKEKKDLEKLELDKKAYELLITRVFSPGALPAKLLEEYIKVIEAYANDYLKTFGQNINISLNLIKRRDQYGIDLNTYANGYLRRITTFSGGESTLIGFAIRLAIGKMLAELYAGAKHPRFLIIDEGFGPLDEELRQKVAEALARLYETREYEQIIIISHQEDLKTHPAFKTILEITKDENGLSHVKEITSA